MKASPRWTKSAFEHSIKHLLECKLWYLFDFFERLLSNISISRNNV